MSNDRIIIELEDALNQIKSVKSTLLIVKEYLQRYQDLIDNGDEKSSYILMIEAAKTNEGLIDIQAQAINRIGEMTLTTDKLFEIYSAASPKGNKENN